MVRTFVRFLKVPPLDLRLFANDVLDAAPGQMVLELDPGV
jgi:hypothetical protein